jgi:peptidoglycan hydrolase CwlO-like protein
MEMLAEMEADIRTNQERAGAYQAKMEQMLARLLKERKAKHEMVAKLDAHQAKMDAAYEEMMASLDAKLEDNSEKFQKAEFVSVVN